MQYRYCFFQVWKQLYHYGSLVVFFMYSTVRIVLNSRHNFKKFLFLGWAVSSQKVPAWCQDCLEIRVILPAWKMFYDVQRLCNNLVGQICKTIPNEQIFMEKFYVENYIFIIEDSNFYFIMNIVHLKWNWFCAKNRYRYWTSEEWN